jgi:hypothetical protein
LQSFVKDPLFGLFFRKREEKRVFEGFFMKKG